MKWVVSWDKAQNFFTQRSKGAKTQLFFYRKDAKTLSFTVEAQH